MRAGRHLGHAAAAHADLPRVRLVGLGVHKKIDAHSCAFDFNLGGAEQVEEQIVPVARHRVCEEQGRSAGPARTGPPQALPGTGAAAPRARGPREL